MSFTFTGYARISDLTGVSSAEITNGLNGTFTIGNTATASSINVTSGANALQLAGDLAEDTPSDPSQTLNGEFIYYEVIRTFSGSDGNTYTAIVFDYDANGDNDISSGEESYFIAFIPNGFDLNNVTAASFSAGPVPPPGTTLTAVSNLANTTAIAITCFAADTNISTPDGDVPICDIQEGDVVSTRNGDQHVRWIGKRYLNQADLDANPKLRPIKILQGSLGQNVPSKDLTVSRQHRIVLNSPAIKNQFGVNAIMVPAIQLTKLAGVYIDEECTSVEYYHLLLDDHEVITANGAPAESLYLGKFAIQAMSDEALNEIKEIFPDLGADMLLALDVPKAPLVREFLQNTMETNNLTSKYAT